MVTYTPGFLGSVWLLGKHSCHILTQSALLTTNLYMSIPNSSRPTRLTSYGSSMNLVVILSHSTVLDVVVLAVWSCIHMFTGRVKIFFGKTLIFKGPLCSNFIFAKMSRVPTCQVSTRSDQQFLKKLTFFEKNWLFKKSTFFLKSQSILELAPIGLRQTIQRPLHYKCVNSRVRNFFQSEEKFVFLTKSWSKNFSKKVHFLVNYATF